MGRGAGNLRTELFLTYLNSINQKEVNFTQLGKTVASFEEMKGNYGWGTNLPYMFSGAFSLPQKQVMEWVGMNRYPISSVVNALKNQKESVEDNFKLPTLERGSFYKTAVILGGGKTADSHCLATKELIEKEEDICVIHAGARNVLNYVDVNCDQFYALVGFESEKLLMNLGDVSELSQTSVYPPFPRQMGTVIPDEIKLKSVELASVEFTNASLESPLTIAIQTALDLGVEKIWLVGFDGYNSTISEAQQYLAQENQNVINDVLKLKNIEVTALTPSKYTGISKSSIYSLL
jgi:4-hydroxy 2-oxovalerate aldolase